MSKYESPKNDGKDTSEQPINRRIKGIQFDKKLLAGVTLDETADFCKIMKHKLEYIERLICLAKSNCVPIMLVASPKYSASESSVYAPVKAICEKYGVQFYDYYTASAYKAHPDWFNEPMHLNKTGARLFSEEIVSNIMEQLN